MFLLLVKSSTSFRSFVHVAERSIHHPPIPTHQSIPSKRDRVEASARFRPFYLRFDQNKTHPLTNTMTSPQPVSQPKPPIPKYLQFAFGGTAGMAATCVVQPIDLIKTRMQLSSAAGPDLVKPGFVSTFQNVAAREGVFGLYRGLSAGLFRQITYTTARLGMFGVVKDFLSSDGKPLPFHKKALAGMIAGGVGAVVGTPAEVALIRMTADGRLPPAERRGYTSVFNALARVTREEGVLTLWRGTFPTVGRAMVLNIAQLATYDQAKEIILSTGAVGDNIGAHAMASTVSGFIATAVSIPLDSAKTRVQNMKVINGVPEYTGMLDALQKTAARDGIVSLWRGFTPYFLRLGPHTILTFICLEQLKAAYQRRRMSVG